MIKDPEKRKCLTYITISESWSPDQGANEQQRVHILTHNLEAEREMGMVWASETPKLNPSDVHLLTRPNLLILPILFHQLETSYSNIQAHGVILYRKKMYIIRTTSIL